MIRKSVQRFSLRRTRSVCAEITLIQNAKARKLDVELKAAAPSELIVEINRDAWPKAGQVTFSNGLTTFGYESWILKPGETRRVFQNLPSGRFAIQLSTPYRSVGANRLESEKHAMAR